MQGPVTARRSPPQPCVCDRGALRSACCSPTCCRQAHSEGLLRRCVLQTLEGLELTLHSACTGVALLTLHTWLEDLRSGLRGCCAPSCQAACGHHVNPPKPAHLQPAAATGGGRGRPDTPAGHAACLLVHASGSQVDPSLFLQGGLHAFWRQSPAWQHTLPACPLFLS